MNNAVNNNTESKITPEIVEKIEGFLEERKTAKDRRHDVSNSDDEAERRSGDDRRDFK